MAKIINGRIECEKKDCETMAFGNIQGVWLCSEHWNKTMKRIQEQNRRAILEE